MFSSDCLREFRESWIPHMTDEGLNRVLNLLETASPLLIHGCFTRSVPMGCLATHIAWHHPRTCHLTLDAGISWLHRVASLNPATSRVIREWDLSNPWDWESRRQLIDLLRAEQAERSAVPEAEAVFV